jgi:hypothetical protein
MEFPPEIVRIISEYSKPVTRPNWRNIRRVCMGDLYNEIMHNKNRRYTRLLAKFVQNIQLHKSFAGLQSHVNNYGFKSCSEKFGIQQSILIKIMNR